MEASKKQPTVTSSIAEHALQWVETAQGLSWRVKSSCFADELGDVQFGVKFLTTMSLVMGAGHQSFCGLHPPHRILFAYEVRHATRVCSLRKACPLQMTAYVHAPYDPEDPACSIAVGSSIVATCTLCLTLPERDAARGATGTCIIPGVLLCYNILYR